MKMPKVAIILLNYNGLKDTSECLESLKKINFENFEIIVVDNDSKNNEADILENNFKNFAKIIKSKENTGFAEGNNIGIRYALNNNHEYILILNNDTIVQPDFLKNIVLTSLESKADMVSPKIYDYYHKDKIDRLGQTYTKSGLCYDRKDNKYKLFSLSACCALYSSKLLNSIVDHDNYYDPDFFMYAEDFDLGFRTILMGYKAAISDQAIIFHKGSASAGKKSDFSLHYLHRNSMWVVLKNLPSKLLLRYIVWIIAMQFIIVLYYIFKGKAKLILKSKWDSLKYLPRILRKRKIIQDKRKISNKELMNMIENKLIIKELI